MMKILVVGGGAVGGYLEAVSDRSGIVVMQK
jgi:ketopantoate reductase